MEPSELALLETFGGDCIEIVAVSDFTNRWPNRHSDLGDRSGDAVIVAEMPQRSSGAWLMAVLRGGG